MAEKNNDPLGLDFGSKRGKKDQRVQLVFRESDLDLIEQARSQTVLSLNEWIIQVLTGYARQKLAHEGITPIEGFAAKAKAERARNRRKGSIKKAILNRDGHKCQKCGAIFDLHVHHIVPRSEGGADDEANLVTLCSNCHRAIHGEEKCEP